MGKRMLLILPVLTVLCMCGCSARELEDRGFPMAIGIDKEEEDLILSFDFPDLSESEKGESPSRKPVNFSTEGRACYEAQKAYENNTNKVLDYSHLKAVILGEELLQDNRALRELLSWLEQQELVARNTCLFAAGGKASGILGLTGETSGTLGEYLAQMLDTQDDFRKNKIVTIGDLMNQWHNQNEILLIPVLKDNGGVPSITEYAVFTAFDYTGNISVEESMKAFLCQGKLKKFLYVLKGGEVLELTNLKRRVQIDEAGEQIAVTTVLTGDARIRKTGETQILTEGKLKKQLNRQLAASMKETAEHLMENFGTDMTNSFISLGIHNRGLYEKYGQDYDGYGERLVFQFRADMEIVNE